MESNDPTHVVAVDRMRNGIMIYFSDGKAGLYLYQALYSWLDKAERVDLELSLQ
jgi:hypothetical protein